LKFKNIILEAKLSNKFKNGHKKSSHVRFPCKSQNFMILGHPSKKSQNYGNPKKFSLPFFNLLDNFSSKMMFLNFKKTFQNFRVFFENGLGSFQAFLILQIRDKPEHQRC
jgi:hypothetical protein